MHEAIVADRRKVVTSALKAGYSFETPVDPCFTLLPFAAALGRNQLIVDMLKIDGGPAHINQANCMGHTALHFAVFTENHELEKILEDAGADMNAKDRMQRRPHDLIPPKLKVP